ncbi:Flagellar M-ring protein [Candidatus Sulfopaludibacter sp. SbA3]|nr:Flagellar M-ring protein [Candidatus Sulfopaludibacter sp. SbA3]
MDQINSLISGLSLKQRISIVAVVHFKHEGDYRPLYTAMAPEDAAGVVQKLRETGVEYRLSENGSAVMVPTEKLAESRLALAAAGMPKTGRIGFELFDKSNFGATEFVEHINYKRALEGELERSVMSLAEVEQARVHLTLPKESVFLDQQQPAKASVMVKLRPGTQISGKNVLAVTNLVASAVEGLTPEAVSVVDMDGTLLSRPKKAAAADGAEVTSESLEVRQQLERDLVAKINETLEPLLGTKNFRAGASVDCDLTSGEQQEETLDPSKSVMTSSQKTEDVTEHATTSGIPGTASNLPQQANSAGKGTNGISRRTENVAYQTSRVIRHTKIPQGVIRRMSLAVLVGQSVTWEGDGAAKHRVLVPPSPETLKTIKDLVAGITGLDAQRGDQLVVETLPFETTLNAEPPSTGKPVSVPGTKGPAWLELVNKYRGLWGPVAVGLALLTVLGRVLFRYTRRNRVREVEVMDELHAPAVRTELSPAAEEIVTAALAAPTPVEDTNELSERVRMVAKREPELTANVLRMWLQESRAEQPQEVATR